MPASTNTKIRTWVHTHSFGIPILQSYRPRDAEPVRGGLYGEYQILEAQGPAAEA